MTKFTAKLNVFFLALVVLLGSTVNLVAAGCHSHAHPNASAPHYVESRGSGVITSKDRHHCHPDTDSEGEKPGRHHCHCCNNHTSNPGLLSSATFQINLRSDFFSSPEKILPPLEVYSTPYIPPQSA